MALSANQVKLKRNLANERATSTLTQSKDDLEEQSADPIADRFRNIVFLATRRKQSYFSHCLNERFTIFLSVLALNIAE